MEIDLKKLPIPGKIYKHYKGGLYEVLLLAKHTEEDDMLVIYKSVQFGTHYARPLSSWCEPLVPYPRFFLYID